MNILKIFINKQKLNKVNMFKKLLSSILSLLVILLPIVNAGLGTYEPGQKVNIRFACLTNSGGQDSGCSAANVTILNPDNVFFDVNSDPAELSDTILPGIWNSSFLIPQNMTDYNGTWLVRIQITNSNSTTATTVTSFQVVDNGFNNIQKNFTSIHSRIAEVSVGSKTNITALNTSITQLNTSITNFDNDKDLGDNFAGISGGILANVSSLNATIRAINASIIDANNLTSRSIDFVNVWSVATRTLTSFGTLITDIWSLNTINRTITTTTGFNISLPATQTNITDLRTNVDTDAEVNQQAVSAGILANVTSLNATIRDINTSIINANNLTSRSIDFVNVWSVATRTLTSFGTLASDVWSQVNRTITTSDNVNVTRPAREENITTSISALSTGIDNNRTTLRTDINTDRESDLGAVSIGITNNFTATNTSLRSYNASIINALNTSITNLDAGTRVWTYGGGISTFIRDLINEIWSSTTRRIITDNNAVNITLPTTQTNITMLNTSITNQDRITSLSPINTTLLTVNKTIIDTLNTSITNQDRVSTGAIVNLTGGDLINLAKNVWNYSDVNNANPGGRFTNGIQG